MRKDYWNWNMCPDLPPVVLMDNHELAGAIHKGMAIDYSRQSMEQAKKNDIVKFDMEKGLAMAIVKKMAGNDNRFHKVFKQYTKKKKKEPGSIGSISDIMAGLNQAAAIATKTVHELAHIAAAKAERGE